MPPVPPSHEDETYGLRLDDDDRIVAYRLVRLLRMGVGEFAAIALAEIQDSPHMIEGLVADGCPVEVAVSIVL